MKVHKIIMVDRGFKLSYASGTPKNFAVHKRYALVQHLDFIIVCFNTNCKQF